jgi:hypothetical protein
VAVALDVGVGEAVRCWVIPLLPGFLDFWGWFGAVPPVPCCVESGALIGGLNLGLTLLPPCQVQEMQAPSGTLSPSTPTLE